MMSTTIAAEKKKAPSARTRLLTWSTRPVLLRIFGLGTITSLVAGDVLNAKNGLDGRGEG